MFRFRYHLAIILLLISAEGLAESSGGKGREFTQRAERRQSQRWTLHEWMAQKDKNRMMDMWLSMNSPSPYELMLGFSHNSYSSESGGTAPATHLSYQGAFSAYAQFIGLSVEHENNVQEGYSNLDGLFNLRLLGNSIQGSHFSLHFGLRTHNQEIPAITLRQQFAQASLQLYLTKQFGIDGLYRQYNSVTDVNLGEVNETLREAGAFIDFYNFRVFGTWYTDTQSTSLNSTLVNTTRTGIRSGLKIFF